MMVNQPAFHVCRWLRARSPDTSVFRYRPAAATLKSGAQVSRPQYPGPAIEPPARSSGRKQPFVGS